MITLEEKLKFILSIPMEIKEKAKEVAKFGGRLYVVGGAVRDALMGIKPKDYDLMVTGLTIEQAREIFGKRIAGNDAPVFLWNNYEVALARVEKRKENARTYSGFEFFTSPDVTVEDDLKRRDFTINAMAVDVLTEKLIDPYGGRKDLNKKIIRLVNEDGFKEDTIRIIRAARFAARYQFSIDPKTVEVIRKMLPDLPYQTKERLWKEIEKGLSDKNPHLFILWLAQLGVLKILFPSIKKIDFSYNVFGKIKRIYETSNKNPYSSLLYIAYLSNASPEEIEKDLRNIKSKASWIKYIKQGLIILKALEKKNYKTLLKSNYLNKFHRNFYYVLYTIAKVEKLDTNKLTKAYIINSSNLKELEIDINDIKDFSPREKGEYILNRKIEMLTEMLLNEKKEKN